MFTLTDPRMQAISQAGENFGSGMGQALNQYVQNKQFSKALEGADTNDLMGMLKRFAQYNVSPEMQERFLSPTIQNRLQSQTAAQLISDAAKNAKNPKDFLSAVLQASALTGNMQGASQLIDMAMGSFLAGEEGAPTEPMEQPNAPRGPGAQQENQAMRRDTVATNGPNQAMNTQDMINSVQNLLSPSRSFPNVQQRPLGAENVRENILTGPTTRPMTPDEQDALRRKLRTKHGLTVGDKEADRIINQTQKQYENEVTQLNLANEASRREQEQLDKYQNYGLSEFQREYGDDSSMPQEFGRMVQDLMLKERGDEKQRYQRIKNKYLKPIKTDLMEFDKVANIPYFETLEGKNKQATLQTINKKAQDFIKRVPEDYKREAVAALRNRLRSNRGIGPVSAEYAIKMPDEEVKKDLKALGPSPKETKIGTGRFGVSVNRNYESELEKAQKRMVPKIINALKKDQSPIVIKDLLVNGLGYPDEIVDRAMTEASKEVDIPDYYQQSFKDSRLKFRPTPLDIIEGKALLNTFEFYR